MAPWAGYLHLLWGSIAWSPWKHGRLRHVTHTQTHLGISRTSRWAAGSHSSCHKRDSSLSLQSCLGLRWEKIKNLWLRKEGRRENCSSAHVTAVLCSVTQLVRHTVDLISGLPVVLPYLHSRKTAPGQSSQVRKLHQRDVSGLEAW